MDSQIYEPNIVTAYGDGGFRILGERHEGSLIVLPTQVVRWPIDAFDQLAREHFAPLAEKFEVLLIGCGIRFDASPKAVIEKLSGLGFSVDVMDTGAACRTYNVLITENRPIAAALVAVE